MNGTGIMGIIIKWYLHQTMHFSILESKTTDMASLGNKPSHRVKVDAISTGI